jgi:hypothetical protein
MGLGFRVWGMYWNLMMTWIVNPQPLNQVTSIPTNLSSLTNLTVLEFEDNEVQVIQPELCSLTSLTWLGIKNNPVPNPPETQRLNILRPWSWHLAQLLVSTVP